jgi:hypothetical protein
MNGEPRLVRWLVACYPAVWRERYGEEFASVLSDSLTASPVYRLPAFLTNVLYGAVDARLNPEGPFMSERVRVSLVTAVWAAGLFGVAGAGFQKVTEYPDLKEAADQHVAVGWSYDVLLAAAALALLALVLVAAAAAMGLVRQRSMGTLKFLAVPLLAGAAWLGALPLAKWLSGNHGVHSAANLLAIAMLVLASLAVVAATAWTAGVMMRRAQVRALPRLGAITLPAVAGTMAAATLACAAWGVGLWVSDPAEFNSDDGLVASSLSGSWAAITVVMAAATALAVIASRRERSASAGRSAA